MGREKYLTHAERSADCDRTALFVFSTYSFSREMYPVARYFRQKGWAVHVLIGWDGGWSAEGTSDVCARTCEADGFVVHHVPLKLKHRVVQHGAPNVSEWNLGEAVKKLGRHSLLSGLRLARWFAINVAENLAAWRFCRGFVETIRPDVVFAGASHSLRYEAVLAQACVESKIPQACIPFSPYIGENDAVRARFSNLAKGMLPVTLRADHSWLNRVLARIYPGWTRERGGKRMFMFNPVQMLAARLTGILPANPWCTPSEMFDAVFVESELSRGMLLESNYPAEKIIVVGKPLLDAVFSNLGNEAYAKGLYAKLGLPVGEPFVLVNIEPSAEHYYSSWEAHWDRYHQLMDCLHQFDVKFVLSLHPLCNPDNYRPVSEKYGFVIADGIKIAELYPYCAFAVSFPCSTNLLAEVFGKRLVMYDFFFMATPNEHGDNNRYIPGASYAHTADELTQLIKSHLARTPGKCSGAPVPQAAEPACEKIYNSVVNRFQLTSRPASQGRSVQQINRIKEPIVQDLLRLLEPIEGPFRLDSAMGKRVLRESRERILARVPKFVLARVRKSTRLKSNANVLDLHESYYRMTADEYLDSRRTQLLETSYLRINHEIAVRCNNARQMVCNRTILGDIIAHLAPTSVCEVGSGAGATLFCLASRFPGIEFTGYELAQSGVDLCKSLQQRGLYASLYAEIYGLTPESDEHIRRVRFQRASAYDISCPDKSFDVVYTFSALEQMAAGLPKALAEIRRISRKYVIFHEPFPEVNDFYGRLYLRAGDYFCSTAEEIEKHGFRAIAFLGNLPIKPTFGYGILVAEVV